MKKLLFFLVLLGGCTFSALPQVEEAEKNTSALFEGTAQEKVFIHYNTSLLFAGDYLYYSLYCLDAESGFLSGLSKIAYAELIGEDGRTILRHKLQLDEGQGQGDFFIPTSLESGNYKLIGYTRWMRNGGENNFFNADIAIVNPYRGDQSGILTNGSAEVDGYEENRFLQPEEEFDLTSFEAVKDKNLEISMSSEVLGSREKFTVQLRNLDKNPTTGTYSLSVRKVDELGSPPRINSRSFSNTYTSIQGGFSMDSILPEIRGSLLHGRIEDAGPDGQGSVKGKKVALSVPGEEHVFKIATTNAKGEFYFNLTGDYSGTKALLQVISENRDNYRITLVPGVEMDYSHLEFGDFEIVPQMRETIVQRSVLNQIENAYYSEKPDTLKAITPADPIYGDAPLTYDLDAYTRFQTIRETFLEIIKDAWITKNPKGDPVFKIRALEGAVDYDLPPLLLVDGLMVQDHSRFIEYPSKGVQKIGILRNNFFVGSHIFRGIILVETIKGDFQDFNNSSHLKPIDLEKPQPHKNYYQQTYSEAFPATHIPDFRTQLLWIPVLKFGETEKIISFFTSDNKGVYEISLEGFTQKGAPVSLKEYFQVK